MRSAVPEISFLVVKALSLVPQASMAKVAESLIYHCTDITRANPNHKQSLNELIGCNS